MAKLTLIKEKDNNILSLTHFESKTIRSIHDAFSLGLYVFICTIENNSTFCRQDIIRQFNVGPEKLAYCLNYLQKNGFITIEDSIFTVHNLDKQSTKKEV